MFTRPQFGLTFFTSPFFGAGDFVPPVPSDHVRQRYFMLNIGSMMGAM